MSVTYKDLVKKVSKVHLMGLTVGFVGSLYTLVTDDIRGLIITLSTLGFYFGGLYVLYELKKQEDSEMKELVRKSAEGAL